jgi:uncharacterized protein YggE
MKEPIIASVGYVETELPANRASVSASFQAVEHTAAEATQKATDKVKALGQALGALGAERVRTQVNLSIQPIYEQYKDREGNRIDNARPDRIERYQATAQLYVDVRDIALLQRVFAAVVAAQPSSTGSLNFRLEPSNESKTAMFDQAVRDAQRRARLAVEATGARLGAVKLIDPTGRACQTDVLVAGAGRSFGPGVPVEVISRDELLQNAAPNAPAPPPPRPAPAADAVAGVTNFISQQEANALLTALPVQPPFQKIQAQVCVVYALPS